MDEGERKSILDRPNMLLFIGMAVAAVLLTPLTSAFENGLTQLAVQSGLYIFIWRTILPVTVRVVAVVLRTFGFNVTVINYSKLLVERDGRLGGVGLLWNCVGWQTLIFFSIALVVILSGSYTLKSKIVCLVIGLDLALFVGLLRILLVVLIDFYFGQWLAVFFHDYLGNIFVVAWALFFCCLSYGRILVREPVG